MDGVLANGELYAHARERTLKVVCHSLRILCTYVHRVRVEVGEYLWYGLVDERVDVHLVYILVFDEVEQIGQSVRTRIDDVQSVAREVIGVESANQYADDNAHCHYQRHEPVRRFHVHNRPDLDI